MSRWSSACITVVLTVAITAGGLLLGNRYLCRQADQPAVFEQGACLDTDGTTTIEDLRVIPQDVKPFAKMFVRTMDLDQRQRLALQFDQRYFAPWNAAEPLFAVRAVAEGARQLADRTWYGENRLRVEPARVQALMALADWAHLPSADQAGIVVKPAFVRVLPTDRPWYEAPDDAPFDHLQFAEIKPNEPVHILHASKDGAWLYIETSYANGWVDPDAIRPADAVMRQRMRDAERIVVVRDFAEVRTETNRMLPQPKVGTLYPLVREERDHWLVEAAVAEGGQRAVFVTARIAKNDARRHPLPLDAEGASRIGNELLKTPYGWGELYRNRDCSATTRDFFIPFGIWLPRNSAKQFASGPSVSLAGLSAADKEQRIREQGIAFRTLLHLRGHIMLYVGLRDHKPVVLHTAWALRYRPENAAEKKAIIGRTILSTLEAGKELPLSQGTLLDRIDGMLLLPVEDWQPGEPAPDPPADTL